MEIVYIQFSLEDKPRSFYRNMFFNLQTNFSSEVDFLNKLET